MQYIIAFLEGIITFISPCLLPMLPIYISYFAGGGERSTAKTLRGALGFVAGFTVIFMLMGALAGTAGSFLKTHQTAVNIVSGAIVIFFGLSYLGVFKLNIFKGSGIKMAPASSGFFPSMLFGMIFSVGWTPCVGAFLGSALMLASSTGGALSGALLLLTYSLGLGIPFLFLSGGESSVHRRLGIKLGNCMQLCVYEHDALSTFAQPLLSVSKVIRDDLGF